MFLQPNNGLVRVRVRGQCLGHTFNLGVYFLDSILWVFRPLGEPLTPMVAVVQMGDVSAFVEFNNGLPSRVEILELGQVKDVRVVRAQQAFVRGGQRAIFAIGRTSFVLGGIDSFLSTSARWRVRRALGSDLGRCHGSQQECKMETCVCM